jgi:NodT family efflux transporter outer membrane factor (OMF) lipoprotein
MTLRLAHSQLQQGISALICAVALAGCTVGPDFVKPGSDLQDAILLPREEHASTVPTSGDEISCQWWLMFNDETLADLQLRAQAENLNVQIAAERIEQSRAQLGIASSQLLPDVGALASYSREALSENGKFAALGAPVSASDFWQLGFDARWELDLWGHARRAREGAAAALEATVYERDVILVALSAEVARTYLQLRGTQAQLDIARQNVTTAERIVLLVESRERNGVATRFESASAYAQLAAVKAMIPGLIQSRDAAMNALALLMGEEPRAPDAQLQEAMPLPSLPESVPVGVSSELAHRRPDIQSAEARLHAATAAIGVAKADFYPRLELRGRIGVEAFETGGLDSWDSRFFSAGPTVYLPIFQGGRLKQRLALNEARQRSAALAYRQTVLQAWHEVDNSFDAWAAQQRRHVELLVSNEQSTQAMHAAERGYQEGATDYLAVLAAQRNLLASQSSLNESATSATLSLVNLYKSLGGGWHQDVAGVASRSCPVTKALQVSSGVGRQL